MAKWTIPDMIPRSQVDAMVAAKLREAAEVAAHEADYVPHKAEDFRKAILALIPTPADAALTKMLSEARAEGMLAAAKVAERYRAKAAWRVEHHPSDSDRHEECEATAGSIAAAIIAAADAIQKEGGA